MKFANVIHWKTGFAPGVRCFSNRDGGQTARRITQLENNYPGTLHLAPDPTSSDSNGVWVFWPDDLGPFPDAARLAAWEADYDARPVEKTLEQRVADLEARTRA